MFRLSRWKIALLVFVALVLIVRALAPGLILKSLNGYLADFSPVYSIHIGDLDLGLLTFSYEFEDVEAVYKKSREKFFDIEDTRVQISFRELLHLRILTDIRIDDGKFVLTKALLSESSTEESREQTKSDAKKASDKLFPVRIAVVEIHDSSFDFADFIQQDPRTRWRVTDIEARVLNVNPLPENPYTSFDVEGKLLGASAFQVVGKAKRLDKPLAWKIDAQMKDFELTTANPILYRNLPFTFTSGRLDLYSEVKSENGLLSGYVKPFLKNAHILKSTETFKSVKHFFFEIGGAFANFMLKNADNKVTATKISFHEEGGRLKVDVGQAIEGAIKNGYSKPLTPGIEDTVPFK